MITLMNNQTANGDGNVTSVVTAGDKIIIIKGTWDTATATIWVSPGGLNEWVAPTASAFTADTSFDINISPDMDVKITLSSVGGSTDLSAWISR